MAGDDKDASSGEPAPGQRVVYLVQDALSQDSSSRNGLDLSTLVARIWARKWLVFAVCFAVTGAGIAYALIAPKWYRATALLAPVEGSSLPAGLGGLANIASLAGLNLSAPSTAESVATLKSRDLQVRFIKERNLLPVLFADKWDATAGKWKTRDGKEPDLRDAVKYFSARVFSVSEDRRTGLMTVAVEWQDPALASDWATALVRQANEQLRTRAELESQTNIDNLTKQLADNRVVGIQQSVGRVLESEIQKLMLAKGSQEFAFRTLDPATPPKFKVRPQRTLIAALSAMGGLALGAILVLLLPGVPVTQKGIARPR